MDILPYEQRIVTSLASLNRQDSVNYAETARQFSLERTTLRRRHKCETTSRANILSDIHKALTAAQEEELIGRIDYLTR